MPRCMELTVSEPTHSLNWSSSVELVLAPLLRPASQEKHNQNYHRSVNHHSPPNSLPLVHRLYVFHVCVTLGAECWRAQYC